MGVYSGDELDPDNASLPGPQPMRKVTRREMLIETAAFGLTARNLSALSGEQRQVRVCLLQEPGLPREDAPDNLGGLLKNLADAKVIVLDAATIMRDGIDAEVFCNSHGSAYPAAISDKVYEFIAGGGSLLHAGGVPFGRAYVREEGNWTVDEKAGTTLREKLGIHVYHPAFPLEYAPGLRQTFDPALIGIPPSTRESPQSERGHYDNAAAPGGGSRPIRHLLNHLSCQTRLPPHARCRSARGPGRKVTSSLDPTDQNVA